MSFRKLTVSSFANVLAQAGTAICAFFVAPALIHGLGKDGYGTWLLIFSIVGYLELLDLGMSGTAVRFLAAAQGKGDEDRFAALFYGLRCHYRRISWIILGGAFLVAAGGLVIPMPESSQRVVGLAALAGMLTGVSFQFRICASLLRATLNYHFLAFTGLGRISLYTVLILVFQDRLTLERLLGLHAGLVLGEQVVIFALSARLLARLIPITYSLEGMRAALLGGVGIGRLWPQIAALGIFAVILLPLSFVVFAWALRRTKINGTLTHF